MGKSAEELRAEAAYQREQLSETVDAIGDRVSPGRIMERRTNRVKDGLGRARESVIGRADSTSHSLAGTAGGLGSTASDAGSAVAGLPSTAAHGMTSTAQGNPLMAGAVAFGAGLLVAAIFPGTKAEGKAATKLKDAAQPLVEQANVSYNVRAATLRGMHFQVAPATEAKLVRCTAGAILDAIVDVRPGSPTYLQSFAIELTADNRRALYVPPMFAHGYQALTDGAEVSYQVSEAYTPGTERGLRHDDPLLGLSWPLPVTVISDKDAGWPLLGGQG